MSKKNTITVIIPRDMIKKKHEVYGNPSHRKGGIPKETLDYFKEIRKELGISITEQIELWLKGYIIKRMW